MSATFPLEFHISDMAFFGFVMFAPAIGFLVLGLILLAAKSKKAAKVCLIIGGSCLLIAFGLCGFS